MIQTTYKTIDYSQLSPEERNRLFGEVGVPTREMNDQERSALNVMLESARALLQRDRARHPEMNPKDPHCFDFWAGALQAVWTKPDFDVQFRQLFVGAFCVFSGDMMRDVDPKLEYFVEIKDKGIDTFGLVGRDDDGKICRVYNLLGVTMKFLKGQDGKNIAEIIPYWIQSLTYLMDGRENRVTKNDS